MAPDTIPRLIAYYRRSVTDKDAIACVGLGKYNRQYWRRGEFELLIKRTRHLLHDHGLRKGNHLVICAPNSPQYLLLFLAAAHSGIVLVPIDFNSQDEFIGDIIRRVKPKLYVRSLLKASHGSAHLPELIVEDLITECMAKPSTTFETVDIEPDDQLEIVFTSGSTGNPKGVVLTHKNVASNVHNMLLTWHIKQDHRFLSIIPISHMFEQTVGTLVAYVTGNRIVYPASLKPTAIEQALRQENITTIVGVPALLQLLEHKIRQNAAGSGKLRALNRLLKLSEKLPARTQPVRRLLFRPVHKALGGHLRIVAVGGAPLPSPLEHFWEDLGVDVLQGYGLTETSPVASLSLPGAKKFSSVGRSLPNQQVRITAEGEILLRGPNVFKQYYHDQAATEASFDDGWYRTGDIGELDNEGYLFLKGRQKNMILTASGLNVYPEDVETIILANPAIHDCVVLGLPHADDIVITAVVLPYADHPHGAPAIPAIIEAANRKLASHQRIQRIEVWPEADFPRTPTRKVKRQNIADFYTHNDGTQAVATETADDSDQLRQLVAAVVQKTAGEVADTSKFVADLQLDSIKRLELISRIEEDFSVSVEESAIGPDTTVGDLRDIIAKAPKPVAQNLHVSLASRITKRVWRPLFQGVVLFLTRRFQTLDVHGQPPTGKPVILVANHTSHFDTPTILRALPRRQRTATSVAAAKDYFFNTRLKAALMRITLGAIPIDRDGFVLDSLIAIGQALSLGNNVILYPEGTRSITGDLQPFRPGVGLLAVSLGVPIIPVKMAGNFAILPKGRHWPRRGRTTVTFGKPLYFSVTETPEEITKKVEAALEKL